jgi:eight-cysteine-cluster-containing protein
VACLVSPCSVTPACQAGLRCEDNYCGGCNAEFYDAGGYAACTAPTSCRSDADCGSDEWCRQVASERTLLESSTGDRPLTSPLPDDPGMECVPFVGEGDSCGGFRPAWAYERCASPLVCDAPDFIADAPGLCRRPCRSNADCAEREYCASDGTCDPDGSCERSVDCNLRGNAFIHPACVGFGVCPEFETQCGWRCGNPQCVDTFGYDFGACAAILGWTVRDGGCVQVSGCSAGPFTLFSSRQSCQQACAGAACTGADCAPTCKELSGVDLLPCLRPSAGFGVLDGECRALPGCPPAGVSVFPTLDSCRERCAPTCRDLKGVDFGNCDAVLGVGVLGGDCRSISGCDTQGIALFQSLLRCERQCGGGCFSDSDCDLGMRCSAGEVCLAPPGCSPQLPLAPAGSSGTVAGNTAAPGALLCPSVCFGECVPDQSCTPGEVITTDSCGNVCSCTAAGRWICTARPCFAECQSDADCAATGCSGQVCAPDPVFTTCEFREEYACYQDPAVASCGCQAGRCGWDQTPALQQCLARHAP